MEGRVEVSVKQIVTVAEYFGTTADTGTIAHGLRAVS